MLVEGEQTNIFASSNKGQVNEYRFFCSLFFFILIYISGWLQETQQTSASKLVVLLILTYGSGVSRMIILITHLHSDNSLARFSTRPQDF
jgi:hypothetical protein